MIRKILVLVLFFSLVAVPSTEVSAIPTGVGVMGDSGTQPYQCIGRGDETSFTWTEVLAALRGIDFGGEPCEPYNQAWSGETVALNMESQTSNVLDDFNAGRIGKVIIMLGHNDLYGNPNTPDIPSVLATYRTNLDRLLNAGIAPGNILMIDVSQENWDGPMKAYVDQFNLGLRNLSIEKGTVFTTWAYFHTEVACRSTDGGNSYNVGGQMIVNSFGNEYHNWRVADGHLGTLANGLFANALVTDFLGVPRMTDAELLTLVNGAVVPSNPPPNCSPAPTLTPLPAGSATATGTVFPTATRTPTPVISPTPTFTWTPTPLVSSTPTTAGSPTATGSSTTITIGETSVLGMSYSGIGNRLVAQQVTLSQSATIQSLSYYVATASGQLRLGIYNNSGTMPGTLVAQTAAFTPVVGWNTQPVLTQTVLPAGTYWLAFLPQN
ncbi:MAG: SGNH/GDSL hydrolase family protein, partial [Chloroflexi bacterium]|nr:SGNH/GDSL hydrolase family protein [Chloroflexota bacterium]